MTEISGNITPIGASTANMDGQVLDIETLMVMLQMERAENINGQLMDQANEMKKKNALLKDAQAILGKARELRPAKDSGKAQVSDEIKNFANQYGIDIKEGNINQSEWDQNIENIKGFIDSTNSSSQMDMIRLQSLNNKYSQAFDMMTNFIKKFSASKDGIIRNMG